MMKAFSTVIFGFWAACVTNYVLCDQHRSDWIDPLNPLDFDPTKIERNYAKYASSQNEEKHEDAFPEKKIHASVRKKELDRYSCEKEKNEIQELEKKLLIKPICQQIYFQQFVKMFVKHLRSAHQGTYHDVNHFEITVSLSDIDIQTLGRFGDSSNEGDTVNSHSILNNMIKRVEQVDVPKEATVDWQWWTTNTCQVVLALVALCIVMQLQWKIGMPWMRIVGSLFVMMFLVSIPWNWHHLYQQMKAAKMANTPPDLPPECNPNEMSLWQSIKSVFSIRDKCKDYYTRVYVDPWVEVPPTKAVAVTITKFVVEPLEHIGEAFGKLIKASIQDLPPHLWPVSLLVVIVGGFLLLIMSFRYKIRLFHFFGLEPVQAALQGSNEKLIKEIQELKQQFITFHGRQEAQLKAIHNQTDQPQIQALPTVRQGDGLQNKAMPEKTESDYVSVCEGQLHPGVTSSQSVAIKTGSDFVSMVTGHKNPCPSFGGDSHPQEKSDTLQEEISGSFVCSSVDNRKCGNGKGKKKRRPVTDLSDSSVAVQCGHTREEDKIMLKAKQRSNLFQSVTTVAGQEEVVTGSGTGDHAGVYRAASDVTLASSQVEEISSQENKKSKLHPVESSDDSDLEIIDEEPEFVST